MAFTFDELFQKNIPYNPDMEYLAVRTTVVITQEDGRTAYGSHWLPLDSANRRLERGMFNADPAHDFFLFFSDREMFRGNGDHLGIRVTQDANGRCNVLFVLKSWGNTENQVNVALPADYLTTGRLYTGRGQTIGHGAGQALYTIAFSDIQKFQIVIG